MLTLQLLVVKIVLYVHFLSNAKFLFPKQSVSISTESFVLIHMDIWGPYSTTTECKYFFTLVDDYTRATWVFLMPNKQQVLSIFQRFVNDIATHFKKFIRMVRSDNGSEFLSQPFTCYLSSIGIVHQTTCPYTPQQNAKVERKYMHLLEMARVLRFQSGLPFKYWGECILKAAYLINRLPTHVLHNKSPFEMLYQKLSDYSLLRAYGCLCFASVHISDKFAPMAIKVVFIGYPFNQKGYKLLNIDNHTIFVSRHVVFHEHIFPYISRSSSVPNAPSHLYNFHDWLLNNPDAPSPFLNGLLPPDSPSFLQTLPLLIFFQIMSLLLLFLFPPIVNLLIFHLSDNLQGLLVNPNGGMITKLQISVNPLL